MSYDAPVNRSALVCLVIIWLANPFAGSADDSSTLILISMDGFRWDYLDLIEVSNLEKLAASGVRAKGLKPVYPSKTFPGHYSIATGLYPGHHGMISNNMYDPEFDAEFHLNLRDEVRNPRWWWGEPIWVTAEKQGVVSAAMFWPGTEAAIAGVSPTHFHYFDASFPFERRVSQVLDWLDLPTEKRPRMITLYFEEPNGTSHRYGPEAPETFAMVRELDRRIGELLDGLERRALRDQIDLILVSDHGFSDVVPERAIILEQFVELDREELFEYGAILQIYPAAGREDEIYAALHGAHPHLAIYRRDEIPARYHLQGNRRVPPILGVPDVGWLVMPRRSFDGFRRGNMRGDHGQDPSNPLMHGLFIAAGPSFRSGVETGTIESVDIYELMTTILGLEPAPNDGDPTALTHLLSQQPAAR